MRFYLGNEIIGYTKSIILYICVTICYMVVASYYYYDVHIYGDAIKLPENAQVPAILAFGDSIVDSGNNNYIPTIGRANFLPYGRDFEGGVPTGRYSNGKVPSDFFAEELGIKELVPPYLDPTLQINDLLTGVSFASGASGYDPQSAEIVNALSLTDQLKLFKDYINRLKGAEGEDRTSTIISQSVYLLCTGSNDLTNTYFALPFARLHYNISSYTTFLVNEASAFVQGLYALGARRIGVISAPPCGCLPSQRTLSGGPLRACSEKENRAAILFNNKLYYELSSLNQKLSGSRIVYLDIYSPLLNLIANPSQYGFEVADRGCCGTGKLEASFLCTEFDPGTCPDASKYIFWDSFHPTEAAYRFIVRDILQKNVNKFF